MTSHVHSHLRLATLPTYQMISTSRLKSLYSDFLRQKHSNPTSYSSNVEWWRRTLEAALLSGWQSHPSSNPDRLSLHVNGSSFAEEFRFEGIGKPLSLAGVIAELCESKAYFPLSQFLNDTRSVYDPGWLPYRIAAFVVGKPLWWALQQLSFVSPDDALSGHASEAERWKQVKGDYVVLALVEKAAEGVLRQQQTKAGLSLADSLYKFDGFKREFASVALEGAVLSDLDMKVVLKFLERDRKVVIAQGEVIKFVNPYDDASSEIPAVDTGVLELKTGVENLQAQVDNIQLQIEQRTEKISTALRRKQKEQALSYLRSRKQLEDLLRKRLGSLGTLQSTLMSVEAAAGDVVIMKSYESSTATLRAILSHPSLRREKIDETLDAMSSANADAKDIDEAIRMGVDMAQAEVGIDESELEAELATLVKEVEAEKAEDDRREKEKQAQQQRERLAAGGLKVPSHIPQQSEESWTDSEIDEEFQRVKAQDIPTNAV